MSGAAPKSAMKTLGIFPLAMINVVAIIGLKNLPTMSEYGFGLILYVVIAALMFFIPTALVSAELATGWPKTGGVYVWVKEAFGERWGFLSVWLQWVSNVVFLPSTLAFGAATLAYGFSPDLAESKMYTIAIVLITVWLFTFINFRGMGVSGMISSVGAIVGTIIPAAVIVFMGILWVAQGKPMAIEVTTESFLPPITTFGQLAMITVVILALQGMEMSASHAGDVKNPAKDFPRAIMVSAIIILAILIAGSLAVAVAVPTSEISLTAGIVQAFETFFDAYGVRWLVPILGIMVAFGVFAQVSSWIAGPPRGLCETGREGSLPPFFQKLNRNDMPVRVLLIQGAIVTVFAFVFLVMPNIGSAFLIMSALTAQTYLIMYVLMFIAALRLRYSQPGVKRPYRIPGGNLGMWVVSGLGVIASVATFALGFFPPTQIQTGSLLIYELVLVIAIIVMCVPPFLFFAFRKPSWRTVEDE
jgi:putative glutamate/gamma-aminobutyrate antiporter